MQLARRRRRRCSIVTSDGQRLVEGDRSDDGTRPCPTTTKRRWPPLLQYSAERGAHLVDALVRSEAPDHHDRALRRAAGCVVVGPGHDGHGNAGSSATRIVAVTPSGTSASQCTCTPAAARIVRCRDCVLHAVEQLAVGLRVVPRRRDGDVQLSRALASPRSRRRIALAEHEVHDVGLPRVHLVRERAVTAATRSLRGSRPRPATSASR